MNSVRSNGLRPLFFKLCLKNVIKEIGLNNIGTKSKFILLFSVWSFYVIYIVTEFICQKLDYI